MSTTTDPYDRLRTARPITALKSANALVRDNKRLYAVGLVLVILTTTYNHLTTGLPLEDTLLLRTFGLLVIPLAWLAFYTMVLRAQHRNRASVRDALTNSAGRYPAYVGAHALTKLLFWGTSLFIILGVTPVVAFVSGYTAPTNAPYGGESIPIDGLGTWVVPVALIAALGAGVVSYYLQFYDLEAILNDAGPREALANSRRLVSDNHRAVFSYFLLRSLLPLVVSIPLAFSPLLGSPADASLLIVAALSLPVIVFGWLLTTLLGAYHVTFYQELTGTTR